MTPLFPPSIRKIAVVTPAGPVDPMILRTGLMALAEKHIKVMLCSGYLADSAPYPYLAADDDSRIADFNYALDSDADLIIAARGGYGTMRILDKINWEKFANRPFLGFSDNTAILLAMKAKGVGRPIAGIHAARFADAQKYPLIADSLRWALNPVGEFALPAADLKVIREGETTAPLYPVNLSILCALLGTPYLPDLTGAVLLLEDIGEPLRKIDRALTQLRLAGILGKLSGLLFGQFSEYPDNPELLQHLFTETAEYIDGPVVSGVPFGHDTPSLTLPFTTIKISENRLVLCP